MSDQTLNVLLVDLDEGAARALESGLARIGGQVIGSVSGEDIADRVRAARPDLILVGVDDRPAWQRLRCRALRSITAAPIVVLADYASPESLVLADEAAIDATLITRVGLSAMLDQLPVIVERWRLAQRRSVLGPLQLGRRDRRLYLGRFSMSVPHAAARFLSRFAARDEAARSTAHRAGERPMGQVVPGPGADFAA